MAGIIVPSLLRLALTMVRELPLAEKFQLVGVATSLVCYGINVCLLIRLLTKSQNKLWATAITLILFLVVSTFQFLTSYVTLKGCTDHNEHSGGAFVCTDVQPFASSRAAVQSTGMIATLLPDFFVLYQCYTVYSLRRRDLWVFGFPVLFLLSSSGSAIYLLMLSTDMSIEVFPHYPLCIFTKFLLTSLIVVKLLRQRTRLRENFEDSPEGPIRPYTSLIYILVQSYALHASLSILFLGLYLARNSAWRMVLPNHVQAGLTSHLLVRSQVVRSRNENKHAGPAKEVSEPIRFSATNPETPTTSTVGNV